MMPLVSGQDVRQIRGWLNQLERRVRQLESATSQTEPITTAPSASRNSPVGVAVLTGLLQSGGTWDGLPLADIYRGENDDHIIAEDVPIWLETAPEAIDYEALAGVRFPVIFAHEVWQGQLPHLQGTADFDGAPSSTVSITLDNGQVIANQSVTLLNLPDPLPSEYEATGTALVWLSGGAWLGVLSATMPPIYYPSGDDGDGEYIPIPGPDGWELIRPPSSGEYALVAVDGVFEWRELGCGS